MRGVGRFFVEHVLICRHGKSNFCIRAAANQPDGQITSDFQKPCQAPKSKIFLFSFYPNQFTDLPRLVPPEGRSRVVTSAGRDAVDAKASGAQRQSQGEMNLVSEMRRAG
jgi:hypothetical protein